MSKKNNRKLSKQRKVEAEKRSALIMELFRTSERLTQSDIEKWRSAWQSAIDVRNPNRLRLLDIYRDAMVDSHLSGCIQQRVGFVMSRSFKLVDKTAMPTMMLCTCSIRPGLRISAVIALRLIGMGTLLSSWAMSLRMVTAAPLSAELN